MTSTQSGPRRPGLVLLTAALVGFGGLSDDTVPTARAAVDEAELAPLRQRLAEDGSLRVWALLDDGSEPGAGAETSSAAHPEIESSGILSSQRRAAIRRCQEACLRDLGDEGYRSSYRYRYSPCLFLELEDAAALERLASSRGVRAVFPDRRGSVSLHESRARIGVDQVEALGLRGAGTVIAVLDTGIDTDHPDLADSILHQHHYLDQGGIVGEGAEDHNGHGSHVAGILTSNGTVAPLGIAPDAMLVVIQTFGADGNGWLSDWTAGLEHVIALVEDGDIDVDVINMSFATHSTFAGSCDTEDVAMNRAVEAAHELGIVLFAATGNRGLPHQTSLPACFTDVIAVGSIDKTEPTEVSWFTNRSSVLDLLAPGGDIVSTSRLGDTGTISGTSQATPHAAGVASLMLSVDPSLQPETIRDLLQQTGTPVQDPDSDRSYPSLDGWAAIASVLLPTPEGLSCEHAVASGSLVLRWAAMPPEGPRGDPVTRLRVDVLRDGRTLESHDLVPTARELRVSLPSPGDYVASIHAVSELAGRADLRGLEQRCTLTVHPPAEPFRRGDCDGSSNVELEDALTTLRALFEHTTAAPPCWRACDSNSDDTVDIADAVFLLIFLFGGGQPPAHPFPGCGEVGIDASTPLPCETVNCP